MTDFVVNADVALYRTVKINFESGVSPCTAEMNERA